MLKLGLKVDDIRIVFLNYVLVNGERNSDYLVQKLDKIFIKLVLLIKDRRISCVFRCDVVRYIE